ncbi:MFS transporter [Clostridium sp. 'deep sea']|uniref:MFS transporter n=1 Tax=Clostridium sp. 'deep sea' TaxID=2779445 RepID=UPI001896A155|nr:MFS transporter [Clostridium sp. 'deep sea']QOR36589.1 MFS transporter [Clostridium sp. 'deep sea']
MSKRKQYLSIASLLSIMLGMALLGGSRGVMVPVLKKDFLIDDSSIGTMLLISTFGYMAFTYVAGSLIYKLGNKRLMQLGVLIVVGSLAIMFWSPSFMWFTIGYFINGIGNAFLIMGVNITTPLYAIAFQAALLNIIHGCYGLGSAIIQRVTGYFIANNISWRYMFLGFIIFHILVLLYVSFSSYPWQQEKKTKVKNELNKPKDKLLTNKMLYLLIITLGFGLMGEHGVNNWFVNYMKGGFNINENIGSIYLSLFFVLFTIGRFTGGFVLEKFGYIRGVFWVQVISAFTFTLGILMGTKGLILITASGLIQAIIYPTVMITIPRYFPNNTARAMSFVSIGVSIINNVSHMVIGYLNVSFGVVKTFYIVPFWVLISAITAGIIFKMSKNTDVNKPALEEI